jgi:branched-subunit amino acid aminotransferase/4-amino-4-deoxychorismate lyase
MHMPLPSGTAEVAWQDGQFLPREHLAVSPGDAGFVLGATVTEQLRTFRGALFLPQAHADRLERSLAVIGLTASRPLPEVFAAAAELAHHNHALLTAGRDAAAADLGLVIFVTPGELAAQHAGRAGSPTTVVHSFPLACSLWAQAYDVGVGLRCVSIQQVPAGCWPISAKIRSRMHYFLADREAAAAEPGARPLLAHTDGRISETSTANVAVVHGRTITVPPPTDALPGVSLGHLEQLAHVAGLSWQARSLHRDDLISADEVLLTSTPWCLQSAVRLDGVPIGSGKPGSVYRQLLAAWSEGVGLDIVAQAQGVA